MSFEKLLADLQTAQTEGDELAKSLAQPEGGAGGGSAAGAGEGEGNGEGNAEGEGVAPLVKSIKVTDEHGVEREGIDGTEMIKALETLQTRIGAGEETMSKAF